MLDSNETLSEKFVKKGFWLYLFTFFIGPLGYIVKVLISRDLSIEEVGIIYGVISFMALISSYSDLGCTESLQYYLPKLIVKNEYGKARYLLGLTLKAQIFTSILIFIIIFILAPWLARDFFKADIIKIIRVAGLFFIGINLIHIASAIFGSVQDVKLQKGTELIRLIGTLSGVSILFFSGTGSVMGYTLTWLGGVIIGISFSWYWGIRKYVIPYFLRTPSTIDTVLRKKFFIYSLSTLFASNVGGLLSQVDMLLIIYLLGMKDVGYYTTYLSLIGIPFLLIMPIITFLFPVISELSGRGENAKIAFLADRFWLYFGIIGIWSSLFLFQMGEELSVLFFGEKFRFAGEILQYSAPFIIFNILAQINFQVLAGRGDIRRKIYILLLVLPINMLLNLFFIKTMGVTGSALAVGISWVPLFLLSIRATDVPFRIWKNLSLYINFGGVVFSYFILAEIKIFRFPFFIEFSLAILLYISIFLLTNLGLSREFMTTIRRVRSGNAPTL